MAYDIYDFTESVKQSKIVEKDIKHVKAAWGKNGDYSEWEGGFLLELKDGRWMYLTGWCDTTGWGCQDGIEETYYDAEPKLESLHNGDGNEVWDIDPSDLNRQVEGKINVSVDH
jgi:hypothetical protein